MVVNVFEVEPNKNWKIKSCKGLELTYKPAKRTETEVQNFPPWAAILASLFAWVSIPDMEIEFTVRKLLAVQTAWDKIKLF